MSSVDGEPARLKVPLATAIQDAKLPRESGEAGAASDGDPGHRPSAIQTTAAVQATAEPAKPHPVPDGGGGLAALLDQARAAQAQLAHQPLPITNHNSRLIMKLFGG